MTKDEFRLILLAYQARNKELCSTENYVNFVFDSYQPERSKREDLNCPHCNDQLIRNKEREKLFFCNECRKSFYENELRYGALNSMET